MPWQLKVLGEASLIDGAKVLRPERKTVGVLTYLALEGTTTRSKLAGLLWPDSEEATARNNLAQVLRRLKKATGQELVVGSDLLSLNGLETDAAKLKVLSFEGGYAELLELKGELLAPHDYDDCPDFADWLFGERERMSDLRKNALLGEMTRLEQEGNYQEALQFAQALIEVDTLSEESHRHTMRLHFLSGDRAAALKAFERCEVILDKELGVEPTRETQQLAKEIEAGTIRSQTTTAKPSIPLSVLRPTLVGRERELEQLREIWERGQVALIRGEPGVGKSRLVSEFLSDKMYLRADGRPGDALPFASYTRAVRQWLRHHTVELPLWVKRELSRLEPALSVDVPASNDNLRLFEAVRELLQGLKVEALVLDDIQFMDTASYDLSRYVLSSFSNTPLRLIASYRRGELQDETSLLQLLDTNQAALVDLYSLEGEMTAKLLESVHIPELKNFSSAMQTSTGGNPMFIIETIKHLIENKRLDVSPDKLPSISKVSSLIQKRLEQLSPPALRLAQVAAVAGTEFDLDLASQVLETHLLELAEPFAELENKQVMRGQAFVHDLLFETAIASIPAPIKTLLALRIARVLDKNGQRAKAAQHYLDSRSSWQSKDNADAVKAFVEVARSISATGKLTEGEVWFERALKIAPDKPTRAQVLVQQARVLERHLNYPEALRLLKEANALALTADALTRASVMNARSMLLYQTYGDLQESYQLALQALETLGDIHTPDVETERAIALNHLGVVAYRKREFGRAEKYHREALELRRNLKNTERVGESLQNMGLVLTEQKDERAREVFREAAELFEKIGDTPNLVRTYNNMGVFEFYLNRLEEAEHYFKLAIKSATDKRSQEMTYSNLGMVFFSQGHYQKAYEAYQKALGSEFDKSNKIERALCFWNIAEVALRLSYFQEVKASLKSVWQLVPEIPDLSLVVDCHWLEGDLNVLREQFDKAKVSYRNCIQTARDASLLEREAEALARLARLEANTAMAQQAITLLDTPTTQAALLVAQGHYRQAREMMAQTKDVFEEARLLLDIYYLTKESDAKVTAQTLLAMLH
jgi:DNA-binding SARP family transcriptional activator/Tfp pilus assembly protein PilF